MDYRIFEHMQKVEQDALPYPQNFRYDQIDLPNPSYTGNLLGESRHADFFVYSFSENSSIIGVSTPETRANTCGLAVRKKGVDIEGRLLEPKHLKIIPSRSHILFPREADAGVGTYQLMAAASGIEETKDFFRAPYDDMALIALPREADYYHPSENLADLLKGDIPYLRLDVKHKDDSTNPFGKTIYVQNGDSLAALDNKKIKRAVFTDSIAGGRNLGGAVQAVKKHHPELEQVLFVSPLNAWLGDVALLNMCEMEYNLKAQLVCMGGFLMSDALRYYSALPIDNSYMWANKLDLKLQQRIWTSEIAETMCAGGDWSGNFYRPSVLSDLGKHLKKYNGQSLKDIIKNAPSPEEAAKIYDGDLTELIPFSTMAGPMLPDFVHHFQENI